MYCVDPVWGLSRCPAIFTPCFWISDKPHSDCVRSHLSPAGFNSWEDGVLFRKISHEPVFCWELSVFFWQFQGFRFHIYGLSSIWSLFSHRLKDMGLFHSFASGHLIFLSSVCSRWCLLSRVCSCHLRQISDVCSYVYSSLDPLSFSVVPGVYFSVPVPCYFSYSSSVIYLEIWNVNSSALFSLFRVTLVIQDLFWFCVNLQISFLFLWKMLHFDWCFIASVKLFLVKWSFLQYYYYQSMSMGSLSIF